MLAITIPTFNRYDLLAKCIASFQKYSEPDGCYTYVIDNGPKRLAVPVLHAAPDVDMDLVCVDEFPNNIGVAASWNMGIRHSLGPKNDWVFVSNDDIEVTCEEDLLVYVRAMEAGATCAVGNQGIGMSLFAISKACIDKVGWFDEAFYPAYFEDWDFHRRMLLAELQQTGVDTGVLHHKSASTNGTKHPAWQANLDRFISKWGYNQKTGTCAFTEAYGHSDI